jgi:hypothetical protein
MCSTREEAERKVADAETIVMEHLVMEAEPEAEASSSEEEVEEEEEEEEEQEDDDEDRDRDALVRRYKSRSDDDENDEDSASQHPSARDVTVDPEMVPPDTNAMDDDGRDGWAKATRASATIMTSSVYMKQRRREVKALEEDKGQATFFSTASFADGFDPHLQAYIVNGARLGGTDCDPTLGSLDRHEYQSRDTAHVHSLYWPGQEGCD